MRQPDELGRLIAAERNALAAIDLAKGVSQKLGNVEAELVQARQHLVQQTQRGDVLEQRLALLQGNIMAHNGRLDMIEERG
jgi:phage shock protein A